MGDATHGASRRQLSLVPCGNETTKLIDPIGFAGGRSGAWGCSEHGFQGTRSPSERLTGLTSGRKWNQPETSPFSFPISWSIADGPNLCFWIWAEIDAQCWTLLRSKAQPSLHRNQQVVVNHRCLNIWNQGDGLILIPRPPVVPVVVCFVGGSFGSKPPNNFDFFP